MRKRASTLKSVIKKLKVASNEANALVKRYEPGIIRLGKRSNAEFVDAFDRPPHRQRYYICSRLNALVLDMRLREQSLSYDGSKRSRSKK